MKDVTKHLPLFDSLLQILLLASEADVSRLLHSIFSRDKGILAAQGVHARDTWKDTYMKQEQQGRLAPLHSPSFGEKSSDVQN